MTGYPEGFLKDPPGWLNRQALADALAGRLKAAMHRLGVVALDILAIGTLWILISYTISWHLHHRIAYTLVPWWAFLLGVVEAAALWESFGRSLGFKVAGRELEPPDGTGPG
ncbi:hypothetical protein H5T52_12255, partial [Candidatus Bipolaricaulota bacterium]|nr:hypothetical protein [Candidatus Bipolaricaulota bacterium]